MIEFGFDENGNFYVRQVYRSKNDSPKRKGKGRSLVVFPASYVVVDLETTGLDTDFCDIIEIGAIRYVNGEKTGEFSTLVKPLEPLDEYITELTGITDEMLENAPPAADVLKDFLAFIGSDLIVGYNVSFDINFLYDKINEFLSLIFSNNFIDVMRIARRVLPDAKNHKLLTVTKHLKISNTIAHRALADCEMCAAVYEEFKKRIVADGGTFEEFSAQFRKPDFKAADVIATKTDFDETHPLFGKVCVFTGALEKMPRRDAMQLVVNLGGVCADHVTKKTDFLILGNYDFCSSVKNGKSTKMKYAEALILKGASIEVLSENVFYDLVLESN